MDYILKIRAKFNCNIIINSITYNLENSDEIAFNLSLNENEKMIIDIFPTNTNKNLESLNYDIEILRNKNELKVISNNVKIFKLKNEYLIELYEDIIIKDINILYSSNSTFIYNTIKTHFLNKSLNIELPDYFTTFENKKIANLSAFEFKNEEKKFLILYTNSKILFEDYYNEMKTEKNTIKILSNINDIAKHGKLTLIDTTNFNKTEEFVYTKNEPKLVKNDKLIPLAFLQALKVKNIKLMKYYLNDSLKDVGNLQNYLDYFGDFKKCTFDFTNGVKANLFYENDSNILHGKTFDFNIINNKIDKITQNNL